MTMKDLNLTYVDKIIYNFMKENPRKFFEMSTTQIAKANFTTPTSVTRFVKKMGYESLKELKNDIEFVHKKTAIFSVKDILASLQKVYVKNFKLVTETLDDEIINAATKKIINSQRCIIYGAGSNFGPAYDFTSNLQKVGMNVFCSESFQRTITNLSALENDPENNLLVIISKRLEGMDNLNLIETAQAMGINLVIITTRQETDFINYEKLIVIKYDDLYSKLKISNSFSIISIHYILEMIFSILVIKYNKYFVNYDEKKRKIKLETFENEY